MRKPKGCGGVEIRQLCHNRGSQEQAAGQPTGRVEIGQKPSAHAGTPWAVRPLIDAGRQCASERGPTSSMPAISTIIIGQLAENAPSMCVTFFPLSTHSANQAGISDASCAAPSSSCADDMLCFAVDQDVGSEVRRREKKKKKPVFHCTRQSYCIVLRGAISLCDQGERVSMLWPGDQSVLSNC